MTHHMSGFGDSGITLSPRLTHASYRYLTPFVENYLKQNATNGLFSPQTPTVFTNVEGMKAEATDNGEAYNVSMLSKMSIPAGGYIGIALPSPVRMSSVEVSDKYIKGAALIPLLARMVKIGANLKAAKPTLMPMYVTWLLRM